MLLPELGESDISIGVAKDEFSKSALEKLAQLSSSPVDELGTLSQGLPASIATGIVCSPPDAQAVNYTPVDFNFPS